MADLAARLTEALDRTEQALTGCGTGWATGSGGLTFGAASGGVPIDGYVWDENLDTDAIGAHMVAWQPTRVRRLIARDRELLDEYANAEAAYADPTTALADTIHVARNNRRLTLRTEVERAATFWLPEEGDHA
jgi:hypothetical protein